MKIILEDHNPDWEIQFAEEKQILLETLSGIDAEIEHVGSTSIRNLCAKPVIDILIGLKDFKLADILIERLEKIGYVYISKYNDIMPYRRFFIKEYQGKRIRHIHMVERGTEFWIRHLLFRNHLRIDKEDREKYNRLKSELAKRDWKDGDEYADAKSEFIKSIENKAFSIQKNVSSNQ